MRKITLIALSGLLALTGCSSEKKESLADEKQALQGGPMPAGTWEKIAAQRKAYEAKHGTTSSGDTPTGPSKGG